jgi:hypothetical protein
VIFVARLKAGQRGASAIEVEDLLVGVIVENQGMLKDTIRDLHPERDRKQFWSSSMRETHTPFLPPKIAAPLLTKIGSVLPRSEAVPPSKEMSVSADLESVLVATEGMRRELNHRETGPLHLLAAALEKPSQTVNLLGEAGIDREKVMDALRKESP